MGDRIEANTMADIYKMGREVLRESPVVRPRGMATKEQLSFSFCLRNPRARLTYHPDRKFNLIQAIGESILLFQPVSRLKYFAWLNPKFQDFSDDDYSLYGAYGKRIAQYISTVVEKLKKDSDSRQAILSIVKIEDHFYKTKDFPCTIALQFLIRDGKLQCHTYMRSNDFIWGTPYDVFMFTILQEVIANELELELGSYYHTATSMHIYERHWELLESIKTVDSVEFSVHYKLKDMEELGEILIAQIDDKECNYNVHNLQPFSTLLIKENAFRRSRPQSVTIADKCVWARPFVKRWADRIMS